MEICMNKPHRLPTWKKLLYSVLALSVAMIFIEGLCSTVHFVHTFGSKVAENMHERVHTGHDSELGWIALKKISIDDGYGPGVAIHTNGQGFRASHDYGISVPANRFCIICSGDSFTWGHGVDDSQTWPAQIERLDPRIETVNVALGGYGMDQAYLRHERDARSLNRNLHVFAFIKEDLDRMAMSSFFGYGKPQLTLDERDGLSVINTPISKRGRFRVFLARNRRLFLESRSLLLLSQVAGKFSTPAPIVPTTDHAIQQRVVHHLLESLAQAEKRQGSRLVMAFLPIKEDVRDRHSTVRWRKFFQSTTDELEIPYVDLVEPFQRASSEQIDTWFRTPHNEPMYHYGNQGNAWVAKQLFDWLNQHQMLPK
jgi:hypothetical protein